MKITLILSFVLCCVIATAQEPVQLEVWTTVKGKLDQFEFPLGISGGLSYVPQFKNGAIPHAFIVNYRPFDATFEQRDGKVLTWGFSTPTDTINRYTWGGKNFIPIFFPDINGDGQRDFMNKDNLYFLGTKNDEPDTSIQYKVDGNIAMIDAFNDDARDDFFLYGSGQMPNPYIAHFVFSNPTLKNFKKYSLVSKNILQDEKSEEIAKAIYKNKQGQWRLLTYCRGWVDGLYQRVWVSEKSVIRLYSLEFTTISEDSASVMATQIDEYRDPKWMDYIPDMNTQDDLQWRPFNNQRLLYNTENYPKILYYASMNTMPDKDKKYDSYATFFDLTNDKIVPSNEKISSFLLLGSVLKHSVDGDKQEDIIRQDGDWTIKILSIDNNGFPVIKSIFQTESILPRGRMTHGFSVNDISGDGIADIACLYQNNSTGNALVILKGQNITTSIKEVPHQSFSIGSPYPLPNSSRLTIPLHTAKNGLYSLTLFSVQGSAYPLFVNKDINEGKTDFMMDISPYSSGNYILRFSDGKTSVEKNIIITH
ncbi:MAG: T9SS type A sorting domain-containing protein [Ignavibacteria bacterium]|nr:T9SS type A sorting domain-containing protein [Ignavibacteria bacterium]